LTTLLADRRVYQSIKRLEKMGLKVKVEQVSDNYAFIAIDVESITNYIKRRIMEEWAYPKSYIEVDWDNKLFLIHIWRGETPKWVEVKIQAEEGEKT